MRPAAAGTSAINRHLGRRLAQQPAGRQPQQNRSEREAVAVLPPSQVTAPAALAVVQQS